MARYAIYRKLEGTATARPVSGTFDVDDLPADTFAARLAVAAADLNATVEGYIRIVDTAELTDLDNDVSTNDYTVNEGSTPPAAITPVVVDRFSLAQKQERVRIRRDILLTDSIGALLLDRFMTDGDVSALLSYRATLRAIPDAPANPDTVSFPSFPVLADNDGDPIWTRLFRKGNVLGAVSLGGLGNPTGALCEHGTTADGRYWKFTDGLLLMSHRMAIDFSSAAQLASTWTFPHTMGTASETLRGVSATFSNKNNSNAAASGQLTNAQLGDSTVILNSFVRTGVSIIVRNNPASLVAGDRTWMELKAMGRWNS